MSETRPGKAGRKMAEVIIENIHLMYQNDSAIGYLRELILTLQDERERRLKGAKEEKQK